MKKTLLTFVAALAVSLAANADDVMKKTKDGTYVVNTTTLCKAKGYKGATPLEVHIKGGKVVKVVSLPNHETKSYYAKVEKNLVSKFAGQKLSKANKLATQQKVDGCTGATYSTKAVQQNVQAALDYYKKHK
jgi:electron transport complex protein RnfG